MIEKQLAMEAELTIGIRRDAAGIQVPVTLAEKVK